MYINLIKISTQYEKKSNNNNQQHDLDRVKLILREKKLWILCFKMSVMAQDINNGIKTFFWSSNLFLRLNIEITYVYNEKRLLKTQNSNFK